MKKPRRRRRSGPARRPPGSTAAQLRSDIDSGRTGEKVDWPDPAAAPLGTDEEAAGTPPSSGLVDAARRRERASPVRASSPRWRPHAAWLQVALVVLLIAAVIGWIVAYL